MIQITCKGNSASCTRTERLTSGMVGLQCEFVFDEAWDGLAKTAVFQAGNEQRDVLLTGAVCKVPPEVMRKPGYQLVIGVYGSSADGTLIIPTCYAMCGSIGPGADPSGDESTDPTLPVWGQLQGMIGNLNDLQTTSKDNLVDAINEAAQSGGGSGGTPITEQTVSGWGFTKNTGTYSKPSGGIPKTDLADDVQASLSKANSALQEHQDVSGKQDTLIQSGAAVGQIAKITAVDDTGKPTAWEPVDMASGGGEWGIDMSSREPDMILEFDEAVQYIMVDSIDGNAIDAKEIAILWEHPAGVDNAVPSYFRINNAVASVFNDTTKLISNFNLNSSMFASSTEESTSIIRVKKITDSVYQQQYISKKQNAGSVTGVINNIYSDVYRNSLGNTSIKQLVVYQSVKIQPGTKVSIWIK